MVSFPWKSKEPKFFPLPTSPTDEERDDSQFVRSQSQGRVWKLSSLVAGAAGLVVLAGASGYFAGRRTVTCSHDHEMAPPPTKPEVSPCVQASHDVYNEGLLAPAGDVPSNMTWNGTFAHIEPSKANYDRAWKPLFPGHTFLGGIVQHPKLAPETSSLAVYHQLHCIQVIHDNFWREIVAPPSGNRTRLPFHMEQCLDYLTQAILCAADTNLEPVDPKYYGKTTAVPRKCRNIQAVFDWARRWATKMPLEGEHGLNYVFSAHRELERTVYIPGFKSTRFPEGHVP
ncbi:MAG: hypothetical protein LQ342_007845 [Letrouitia transgressa]|nr:MAG: hypothetical protein LQ342_007845 [Letrouitia transgressa]